MPTKISDKPSFRVPSAFGSFKSHAPIMPRMKIITMEAPTPANGALNLLCTEGSLILSTGTDKITKI